MVMMLLPDADSHGLEFVHSALRVSLSDEVECLILVPSFLHVVLVDLVVVRQLLLFPH